MATHSQTKVLNDMHFDKSATVQIDEQSTDIVILTPSTGKSIAIKGVLLTSDASSGQVRLHFAADEDGNANTIAVLYVDGESGYLPLIMKGDPNEPVYVDTTTAGPHYIHINYREE